MDGLEVGQVVVLQIHTNTEEQARISSVHYLEIPELKKGFIKGTSSVAESTYSNKVGVFGVSHGHDSVHLFD